MREGTQQRIDLPYGDGGGIELEIDESRVAGLFRAPPPVADLPGAIESALNDPLDFPPLEQSVIPDDRVTIVLDRDLPHGARIVAAVWQRLARRDIAPEQVTILQSAPPGGAESIDPRSLLPEPVRRRLIWTIHEPAAEEEGTLHYLATTAAGRRIYLAEELVFADVVLAVGRIGFDPLLGFRGTHSAFFPDLSSIEAIRQSQGEGHQELAPENDRPLRQTVDEIGWLLGAAVTIQAIPARRGQIASLLCGNSEAVLRQGREMLCERWRIEAGERVGAVVVGVDHAPGEDGWSRLAAALALAAGLVERGGRIIVLSDLADPPGAGIELLRHVEEPAEALPQLREAAPADLLAATQYAAAADWARLYLLSRLEGDLVEELFAIPVDEGRDIERLLRNSDDRCLFIESGQFVDGRVV